MAVWPRGKSHSRCKRRAPKVGNWRRSSTTRWASSPVILCGQECGARESSCKPFNPCASYRRSHLRTVGTVVRKARAAALMPC